MSLKNKITLLLVVVYVLLLAILLGQRLFYSIPEMKALQEQSDFNEVERVVKAIEYQGLEVSRITYDYGVWDDTYEFMETHDPEYLADNFVDDKFISLAINGIVFFDRQGELIWSKGFVQEQTEETDSDWQTSAELESTLAAIFDENFDLNQLPFKNLADERESALKSVGVLPGEDYLLIYARVSIMPTTPKGESRGTLVMVRALTPAIVEQLQDTSQQQFSLYQFKDVGNDKKLAMLAPKLDRLDKGQVLRVDGFGHRWLKSSQKSPVALIKVSLSEAIFNESLFDSITITVLLIATVTMLVLRVMLQYLVVTPLVIVSQHLQSIRESANYSLRLDNKREDEIGDLCRECDSLVDYVSVQEEYLRAINQDLTKKTLEDGLTEIANRRHFDVKIELLCRAYAQKRQPIFVVLVDVDYFKAFNDNYGHLKGDEALKSIADELLKNVRVSTDMVARYGGEEFAILLTETDITGVKIVCNKLLEAIRTLNIPHEYSDAAPRVTVSMGVSGWIPKEDESKVLVAAADQALYEAKDAGRDCVQYHVRDDSISR